MRGSVQIAGSCTGRPLGICIRNARSPPRPSVAEQRVASKGRGAGRLSDGWTSERTEERMSRMRVRGRNFSLHVFQRTTPRLENEGQSAVRISRRNEQPALERCLRVNRFAGCNFLPRAASFGIYCPHCPFIDLDLGRDPDWFLSTRLRWWKIDTNWVLLFWLIPNCSILKFLTLREQCWIYLIYSFFSLSLFSFIIKISKLEISIITNRKWHER